MAKRLNPKRRRELWERRMMSQANPSALTNEGQMRSNSSQWSKPSGSSNGLARGILHMEANQPQYVKPKRRKASAKALHVNPKDVEKILTPDKVKGSLDAQWPLPRKTAKKLWGQS